MLYLFFFVFSCYLFVITATAHDTNEVPSEYQRCISPWYYSIMLRWDPFGLAQLLKIASAVSDESVKIEINQGVLEGEKVQTVLGHYYYSFKGIPYAKPPVGDLRFKAPQNPESWDGARNATIHGFPCPQVPTIRNEQYTGCEDCLFLNVYTSNLKPHMPLPVLVAFPGGIYRYGTGNVDIYAPDFLVSSNIIVVTVNHRVDALGFLSLGTSEVSGNTALKDQVAALKWIQNNIQRFGGDTTRVTLFGESSAAGAVGFHLVSPMSKGLFKRAIVISGSPLCDWNIAYKPEKRAFALARSIGFKGSNKSKLLNFLQSVPSQSLVNSSCRLLQPELETNPFKFTQFSPITERQHAQENFLPEDVEVLLKSGKVNKVDVLFSYANQEALVGVTLYESYLIENYKTYPEMFVPLKILLKSSPDKVKYLSDKIVTHFYGNKTISKENMKQFINYANGAVFSYCTQKFLRLWPSVGNAYLSKFSLFSKRNYYGTLGIPYNIMGASHSDQLFYLFDPKLHNLPVTKDSREHKFIQQLVTLYTNFIKYGNPTPDSSLGVIWPKFNTSTLAYLDIAENTTVGYAPDEDMLKFWDSIYEEGGFPL